MQEGGPEVNPNEAGRLAHAINDLRPDWPVSSLRTFIERNLANRAYRDAVVALVWVAVDRKVDGSPASDTPKRVLEAGPWWRAAGIEDQTINRPHPPTRSEQCKRCGGRRPACACTREHLADDQREPDHPHARPDSPADATLARALLAQSRAACCGCGIKAELCPTHRPTEEIA
jgi:hypothetical protein